MSSGLPVQGRGRDERTGRRGWRREGVWIGTETGSYQRENEEKGPLRSGRRSTALPCADAPHRALRGSMTPFLPLPCAFLIPFREQVPHFPVTTSHPQPPPSPIAAVPCRTTYVPNSYVFSFPSCAELSCPLELHFLFNRLRTASVFL